MFNKDVYFHEEVYIFFYIIENYVLIRQNKTAFIWENEQTIQKIQKIIVIIIVSAIIILVSLRFCVTKNDFSKWG